MSTELARIEALLVDLDEEQLLEVVNNCLEAGDDPMEIVKACRGGMEEVGRRFSTQEYFVNELIVSAELFKSVMQVVGPRLAADESQGPKTKVVIGTVKDDIHDIGKDIVVSMLQCNGFEVYDLGINVPPQTFVDKVKETGAKVVGLSGLLTIAFASMEATIKALRKAAPDVKVMIGGGMTDDMVCQSVGADAWGHDAVEAVTLAKSFSEVGAK